jgi:hypothetical protein
MDSQTTKIGNSLKPFMVWIADAQADFVGALTDLLRSIGTAVQEHEEAVSKAFGKDMTWQVATSPSSPFQKTVTVVLRNPSDQ